MEKLGRERERKREKERKDEREEGRERKRTERDKHRRHVARGEDRREGQGLIDVSDAEGAAKMAEECEQNPPIRPQ